MTTTMLRAACHPGHQAFRSGPVYGARTARLQAARCTSSSEASAGYPSVPSTRRQALSVALLSGFAAAALHNPLPARAEGACSDFNTASDGIQWCETKEGSGKTPTKGQLIRCHYTGRLSSNGRVFDSSYDRRRPLTFKVGAREVIQGWDKAILGDDDLPPMKEGGKRRVVIPSELAYGNRGAGGLIPPNASLTFDIELLAKR